MAVIDKESNSAVEAVLERRLTLNVDLTWEKAAYIALLGIALLLRLWDLGPRMLHHDESLHATYSWYLYIGRGYKHDPMMHGPFQFHATALIYFLLGVSDATARVVPALFGTALVGTPYLLRGHLGKSGALVAALLLTISPSFLYFSRFARNDIYIAVWSTAIVILMFRYFAARRSVYLYVLAAMLSLSFSTKENTYITMAIFGSFLLVVTGLEFTKLLKSNVTLSPPAEVMVLFGTFLLPLMAGFGAKAESILGIRAFSVEEYYYFGFIVLALFALSIVVGWRWNRNVWTRCAIVFWGIFITLHTTFFGNPQGIATGIVGALKYWLEQQNVARGNQPWYYYLVLLSIYEFLPIIFALGGIVYFVKRRDLFTAFLIYWIFGSLVLYGWASEKMPWLGLHMALPIVLLAGKTVGELVDAKSLRQSLGRQALYIGLLTIGVVMLLVSLFNRPAVGAATPIQRQTETLQSATVLLIVLGLLSGIVYLARKLTIRSTLQVLALTAFVVLLPLSARAAWQVTYVNGDVPVEMMVYTQTSPDVGLVMREIERVGFRTGAGKDLKVAYDAGVSWPFEWYLRDYRYRNYFGDGLPAPDAPVVLVSFENDHDARVGPYLAGNYVGQRYKLRWWFPEDYRDMSFGRIWQGLTDPTVRKKLWNFFLYREPFSPLGSTDFMMYVRKDLAAGLWVTKAEATDSLTPVTSQASPATAETKDISDAQGWGSKGSGAGQLLEPKGIAIGPDGSIYVLDTGNNRVQKFDVQGRLVTAWGARGQGDGEFNEPWGIAVDAGGNVFVADTWNHRIQKFDANGAFLAKWGEFANTLDPSAAAGKFFGPRGIAIDSRGFIYVTDTGNHRVQKFSHDGGFVTSSGGRGTAPGQFAEPVGIAVDPSGTLLIADTWNRRLQRLDTDLRPLQQWPVTGWPSNSALNKPYVAVDMQGDMFVTDPENDRILQLANDGILVAVWQNRRDPASLKAPTGIAIANYGRIYVVDSLNHRLLTFPLPR